MYDTNLQKADIDFATSGDHEVIAAPENGYIAIDHINFLPSSAVTIQLKQGTDNYGGAYYLANQAFVLENAMMNYKGVITLLPGEAFVINTDTGVQVSGFIRYRVIV
jgi:hypothetical protein